MYMFIYIEIYACFTNLARKGGGLVLAGGPSGAGGPPGILIFLIHYSDYLILVNQL